MPARGDLVVLDLQARDALVHVRKGLFDDLWNLRSRLKAFEDVGARDDAEGSGHVQAGGIGCGFTQYVSVAIQRGRLLPEASFHADILA